MALGWDLIVEQGRLNWETRPLGLLTLPPLYLGQLERTNLYRCKAPIILQGGHC